MNGFARFGWPNILGRKVLLLESSIPTELKDRYKVISDDG